MKEDHPMSTVKDFLKELRESPKGMELLNAAKEPANAEEAAQLYADIAEKAGISVSQETICEFRQPQCHRRLSLHILLPQQSLLPLQQC